MSTTLFKKRCDGDLKRIEDAGAHIASQFQHWIDSLGILFFLAVPHYLAKDSFEQVDHHLFSNAAEMAYGAAICARKVSGTGTLSSLLATKSRLAPRKTLCLKDLSFVQGFWAVNY